MRMTAVTDSKTEKKKFNTPTVFLVRHGDTKFNTGDPATDRAKGIQDLPLVERGYEKAREDAKQLAPLNIAEVHHSPLKRSSQSAAPIISATGAKPVSNADL